METDAKKDFECVIEPIAVLKGHADRVWAVAWNPVQPLLASCSGDKSIRLWSYRSSVPYSSSSPPALSSPEANVNFALTSELTTGHRKTVRSVAWAPSGKTLAAGSFDSTVSIWERARGEDEDLEGGNDSSEWECVTTLEGHESECKSVAYSRDGGLLASCSRDKSVWIWEVQPDADFECLSVLMHHTQDVKCVAWHPHEEILASASYDDTIHLYADDPQDDWYPFHTLSTHRSTVWSIAFSPEGNLLASASDDRTIRIFRRLPRPPPIVSSNPFAGRVSINGKGDSGAGVESKWEEACVIEGAHERSIYSISWAQVDVLGLADSVAEDEEDRGLILSVGGDGRINVWHITISKPKPSTEADHGMESHIADIHHRQIVSLENSHGVNDVNCITWCPMRVMQRTGTAMFATCGDDCTVRVWRLNRASAS